MTVFMSLILIYEDLLKWAFFPSLSRFTEMGLLSIFKADKLVKMTRISIWHTLMGLRNDNVVFCIKIYLWAYGIVMLLSAFIYITIQVVKNMTVLMSLSFILRRFTEMGLLLILQRFTEMSLLNIFSP